MCISLTTCAQTYTNTSMTFATKKSNLISKVNFEIRRKKKTEIRGSYDKITGSFCKMKFSS